MRFVLICDLICSINNITIIVEVFGLCLLYSGGVLRILMQLFSVIFVPGFAMHNRKLKSNLPVGRHARSPVL